MYLLTQKNEYLLCNKKSVEYTDEKMRFFPVYLAPEAMLRLLARCARCGGNNKLLYTFSKLVVY